MFALLLAQQWYIDEHTCNACTFTQVIFDQQEIRQVTKSCFKSDRLNIYASYRNSNV